LGGEEYHSGMFADDRDPQVEALTWHDGDTVAAEGFVDLSPSACIVGAGCSDLIL
jgi:hypothetical protein